MTKGRRGTLRAPEYEPYYADHLPPVPDLLQRLSWEHRQIEKLWNDLQRLHHHDGTSPQPRLGNDTEDGVARMLVRTLADHEAAEMAALYPAAAKVMPPEWAEGAMAEHDELRAALEEVDGADPEDEAVFAVLERAMAGFLAHMNEEEAVVFPVMRVASPPEDLVNPEGYDFLGLPPGKTMIAAIAEPRSRALGTGRSRPAPRPEPEVAAATGAETGTAVQADGAGSGDGGPEIDLRDSQADPGGSRGDGAVATTTRAKRLLRRR